MPLDHHQRQAATKVVALEQSVSPVDWEALELEDGALRTHLSSQENPIEVEGTVSVDNLNGLTDTELRATPVEVTDTKSSTAVTTTPTVANTSGEVLAANANRLGATVSNPGVDTVFINFGAAATVNHHPLEGGSSLLLSVYTGALNAIVASGTQALVVTEFTA